MTASTSIFPIAPASCTPGSLLHVPGQRGHRGLCCLDLFACYYELPESWMEPAGLDSITCQVLWLKDKSTVQYTVWLYPGADTHHIMVGDIDMEGELLRAAGDNWTPLVRTDMRPTHGFPPASATVQLDKPFDPTEIEHPGWGPSFYTRFRIVAK